MMLLYYTILGIVQGVVEALPISSSGHLFIVNDLLTNYLGFKEIALNNTELLTTITNFGSLVAVVIIYFDEVVKVLKDFFGYIFRKEKKCYVNYKYGLYIIFATIPVGFIGLIASILGLFDALENNIKIIGITLFITGLFLFWIRKANGTRKKEDITIKDAMFVGGFEILGLLPGISRSGSTIVGGLYKGLNRLTAFDFSFMLYIPVSCGTTLLSMKELFSSGLTGSEILFYLFSALIAGIFTYVSVKWFRNIIKNGKLIYFAVYCFIAALLILLFL